MAKCTVEFAYTIGDRVIDDGGRKCRIIRLSIDQYGTQFCYCANEDVGNTWWPAGILEPCPEQQGG